jgi:hypothetical protein
MVPSKDIKKSKKYFEKGIELNCIEVCSNLPITTFEVDNIKILKKAIKYDKKLISNLAFSYGDKGNIKKKEKYLKKLIKLKLTDAYIWKYSNSYYNLYEITQKKKYFEKSGNF